MTSKIRFRGATSGFVELAAPDAAGSNTLILPSGNGASGDFLRTDGSGSLSFAVPTDTSLAWTTQQSAASGESALLFGASTGDGIIPSTVEQVIIAYTNLSISTTGSVRIRLGDSGGIETTNSYNMFRGFFGSSTGGGVATTSFFGQENFTSASNAYNGTVFITRNTTNGWSVMWNQCEVTSNTMGVCTGEKSLSDVLTQVQFFPSAGTFDSGSVRFKYLS